MFVFGVGVYCIVCVSEFECVFLVIRGFDRHPRRLSSAPKNAESALYIQGFYYSLPSAIRVIFYSFALNSFVSISP